MNTLTAANEGFAHNEGFGGSSTLQELQNLNKALDAQQITGIGTANSTTAGGAPLKIESLDKTLKVLTYTQDVLNIWKMIPKTQIYNTVHQYTQLSSYGQDRGGFNLEGELPLEEDSTYIQRFQTVKYLGTTRSVTHPMQLVNTILPAGVMQREIENGTMWLIKKLDLAILQADSALIPVEFDGIYKQHAANDQFGTYGTSAQRDAYYNSPLVIDMRGAALNEKSIEKANEGLIENFSLGSQLFLAPKALSNFTANYYGNKSIYVGAPNAVSNATVGQSVNNVQTQYGLLGLNMDVFMNPEKTKTTASIATSVNAPAAPTGTSVTPVAATAQSSAWGTGDAGTYYYAVSALGRYGESALTVLNSGSIATIVANGAVDLVFTATAGVNATTGFKIYRSNKAATSAAAATFYPLFTVTTTDLANGYDYGAAGAIRDLNRILPGMTQGFLIQKDTQVLEYAQLTPLIKMDLAQVSPATRFMLLQYGMPILYTPQRMVKFINIGGI
jgi:hypothetical protein